MAKFKVVGSIIHIPGPWGVAVPCTDATVKVYDIDTAVENAGGDDLLYTGATKKTGSSAGTFSGTTTKDWRGKVPNPIYNQWASNAAVSAGLPAIPKKIPNPQDVFALRATVSQGPHTLSVLPFINNAPVPIVVPWQPAGWQPANPTIDILAAVNDTVFTTQDSPTEIVEAVRTLAEDSGTDKISIRLYGPAAEAMGVLANKSGTELRTMFFDHFDVTGAHAKFLKPNPVEWATVVLLIALVFILFVLAPIAHAASFVLVCIGLALLLAVALGWAELSISTCSQGEMDGDVADPGVSIPVAFTNCTTLDMSRGEDGETVLNWIEAFRTTPNATLSAVATRRTPSRRRRPR